MNDDAKKAARRLGRSRRARAEIVARIRRRAVNLECVNPARAAQLKQSLNLWTKPETK